MPRRSETTRLLAAFGAQVRTLRKERNLSLSALARRCALFKGNLSSIEHGLANVTLFTIERLADGLGVSCAALFPIGVNGPQTNRASHHAGDPERSSKERIGADDPSPPRA
jgi:transcriptional regulator with XRE-family HTH domain